MVGFGVGVKCMYSLGLNKPSVCAYKIMHIRSLSVIRSLFIIIRLIHRTAYKIEIEQFTTRQCGNYRGVGVQPSPVKFSTPQFTCIRHLWGSVSTLPQSLMQSWTWVIF
jgi:hypothetical protein